MTNGNTVRTITYTLLKLGNREQSSESSRGIYLPKKEIMMASGLNTWHILIIWYICNFLRQTDRKIFFLATAQPKSRQNGHFIYFRGKHSNH